MNWLSVSCPVAPGDPLPRERKPVLVWCEGSAIPWVGYVRYAAGDPESPYFVVPHGNLDRSTRVVAWSDCIPQTAPKGFAPMSVHGRPARRPTPEESDA